MKNKDMAEISSQTIAEMASLFEESESRNVKGGMSRISRMESHIECTADTLNRLLTLNPSQTALMRVLMFYALNSQEEDKRDIVRTLMGKNGLCELVNHIEASHSELCIMQEVLDTICNS